jgi:hypothetical protein
MMLTTILTEPADGAARMADAKLFGRVSTGLAETFFASGKVQPIVKSRVRYPRLEPGTVITEAALGRALIERGAEKARRRGSGHARTECAHEAVDDQPRRPSSEPANLI